MNENIIVEKTFPGWGGYTSVGGGLATTQLVMQGTVPIGKVFPKDTCSFGRPLKSSELISPPNLPEILKEFESRGVAIHESVWHVIQAALGETTS